MDDIVKPPSESELNRLRRDASEGDPDAAAFFRKGDANGALKRWRSKYESN